MLIMAVFWVTEALPINVTALLPVFLFPVVGVMSAGDVAAVFFNVSYTRITFSTLTHCFYTSIYVFPVSGPQREGTPFICSVQCLIWVVFTLKYIKLCSPFQAPKRGNIMPNMCRSTSLSSLTCMIYRYQHCMDITTCQSL